MAYRSYEEHSWLVIFKTDRMISLLLSWSLNKNKIYWEETHLIPKNHNIPITDHLNEHRLWIDSKDFKNPQLTVECTMNLSIHLVLIMESKHRHAVRVHNSLSLTTSGNGGLWWPGKKRQQIVCAHTPVTAGYVHRSWKWPYNLFANLHAKTVNKQALWKIKSLRNL